MNNCKKRGKMFFAIGILAIFGVATGLIVSSCGRHDFDMQKNPERVKKMINWKVNDVLDEIDADDAQRRHILASVNQLVDEGLAMHNDKMRHKDIIHAELAKDQPDAEKLHSLLDDKIEQFREFSHRALDVVLDIHATLTPEQRQELMDTIDDYHHSR